MAITQEKNKIEWITRKKTEKWGKEDGRKTEKRMWPLTPREKTPTPSSTDTNPSQKEQYLWDIANSKVVNIRQRYLKEDNELDGQSRKIEKEKEQLTVDIGKAREQLTVQEVLDKIQGIREKKKAIEEEKKKIEEEKNELERTSSYKRSFWIMGAVMMAILGETVFNVKAFEILGFGELTTWIMALTVIVTIPLYGIFMGNLLKREQTPDRERIIAFIVTPLIIITIVGMGWLRELLKEDAGISESLSFTWSFVFFTCINFLLLGMMIWAEYKGTPSDPEKHDKAKLDLKGCGKRLNSKKEELDLLNKQENEIDPNTKIKALKDELRSIEQKIIDLDIQGKKKGLRIIYQGEVEKEINEWRALIRSYRDANKKARAPIPTPVFFNNDPIPFIKISGFEVNDKNVLKQIEEIQNGGGENVENLQ